jgi:uncharacterized membrane protein
VTPLETFLLGFWGIFWAGILLTIILAPSEVRIPILTRCLELMVELVRAPFTRAFWHRHKWVHKHFQQLDAVVFYRACVRCGAVEEMGRFT